MAPNDRRATIIRLLVAAVVLIGGYVGLAAWSAQHLPSTVSVGGIPIGGLTEAEAKQAIETKSKPLLATPIALSVPGIEDPVEIIPGEAGFSVHAERTLDGLTGFTLNPVTVWNRLVGSVKAPLLTHVDDEVLTQTLTKLAPSVETKPTEGSVTFPDGKVEVTAPVAGRTLDIAGTKLALRKAFPHATTATATVSPIEPQVTGEAVAAAARDFGEKAMSGPITVVAGTSKGKIDPEDYAPAVKMVPDGKGALEPKFDTKKLTAVVSSKVKVSTKKAKDASWTFEGGRPRIIPSVDGTAVDESAIADGVITAMTSDDRRVELKVVTTKPKFTTEDAKKAGVKELVVDFQSPFPPEDTTRTQNLIVASRTINGTYIAPGETFSLNGILGERTTAKGYRDGTVIINGRLTRGTGGGISQVSTVIYNMAYFAGVQILEFTPHAFFIPRYPEGREATVFWPSVDNKWKNDTPHGMLLQTWVDGGYVHGRVWSTKTWDIKSIKGERRNVKEPETIKDDSPTCYPQQPQPGFDVTVTRQWYRPGSSTLVKSEAVNTHYIPEHEIICTDPNAKP
ncbi:VanW family protein [Intrasporangium calvum]|uniref:VanW family protein n=1 Tax=Intrasporangium calvum TaxID=53358 RepID=A0ABT5GHP3_9MICO|nr:VanW family protein [Intrasporangium calvum]MDC5697768.1 VanW family protein [Intrasporangium calvum]